MDKTLADLSREYDLRLIESAEFPRLLQLAHEKGRLAAALGVAGLSGLLVLEQRCTGAEWAAFWKIGQIKEIASSGFVGRVALAREEGLLDLVLAGDLEAVDRRASELIASLRG